MTAATTCQNKACQRPTQLYLCSDCEADLRDMFTALVTGATHTETIVTRQGRTASGGRWRIEHDRTRRAPGLLEDLADAATGQTRFGGSNRRLNSDESPLRFNDRARTLIADIRTELHTWTTLLATQAGAPRFAPPSPNDLAAYAQWLAHHTHEIAKLERAGRIHNRLRNLTRRAQNCVDRPPAPRFCGQCDTKIDRKICGLPLYARRDAIEVTCPNPACRTVHNIEKLFNRTLNNADNKTFPREVLIGNQRTDNADRYTTGIMGELDEFVHWRAFHHWVMKGHLRARVYLRPNGRRGITWHSDADIPEYRLADVRKVKREMDRKTGKAKTG